MLKAASRPTNFLQVYATPSLPAFHAISSIPPNGASGESYGSPAIMSTACITLPPSNDAKKTWLRVPSSQRFQWRYIKSSYTSPVLFCKSGLRSAAVSITLTLLMKTAFFLSGESFSPSIPSETSDIFNKSPPLADTEYKAPPLSPFPYEEIKAKRSPSNQKTFDTSSVGRSTRCA